MVRQGCTPLSYVYITIWLAVIRLFLTEISRWECLYVIHNITMQWFQAYIWNTYENMSPLWLGIIADMSANLKNVNWCWNIFLILLANHFCPFWIYECHAIYCKASTFYGNYLYATWQNVKITFIFSKFNILWMWECQEHSIFGFYNSAGKLYWKHPNLDVFGFTFMLWAIFSYFVLTFSNKHYFPLPSHLLIWIQSWKRWSVIFLIFAVPK